MQGGRCPLQEGNYTIDSRGMVMFYLNLTSYSKSETSIAPTSVCILPLTAVLMALEAMLASTENFIFDL